MKILMLSPDAQMIDRRILQEAHSLQRRGHEVTVLSGFECRAPDVYEYDDGVVVKRYVYDWRDRRLQALRQRRRWTWRLSWPWIRLYGRLTGAPNAYDLFVAEKALEHRFDVVHAHDYPVLPAAALAACERRVPLIYDSHEFYPVQSTFTPAQQRYHLARERKFARKCAQVITVNPYLAKMIGEAHDIPDPLVILNACPMPEIDNDGALLRTDVQRRRDRRAEFGLPANAFVFLYQGWISQERNLDAMIHAIARVPAPAVLAIVGYGEYRLELEKIAESLCVLDRVLFLGRIESDELARMTPVADVGLIPYAAIDEMHRYCSPNKLFEFVMAGLPVIANDLPYLRDVVAGNDFGWLGDLENVERLAGMMSDAMADPQRLAQYANNALVARRTLNWDVEATKLAAVYERLSRRHSATPEAG